MRVTANPTYRKFWFSRTEILHIIVGVCLVSAIGLSISFESAGINTLSIGIPSVVLFTVGFMLHEFAHKFVAQMHGLWAEFRLTTTGVIITAISIIAPIKFVAPGMVMIAGSATATTIGLLAVAGPVANISVSLFSVFGWMLASTTILRHVFALGCWINAYMALFNMIPFGQFDGLKVFRWSKPSWIGVVLVSAMLVFVSSHTVFR
jgi:Zn-dependent protease